MRKLKTTVNYRVSDGLYCNLTTKRFKGNPAEQRCRFCTNLDERGYVCVLHNERLSLDDGYLIRKAPNCLYHKGVEIEDTDKVTLQPQDIVNWAIDEYSRIYNQLINDGYPVKLAMDAAKEMVSQ